MENRSFYTRNGWKGENYTSSLTTKDIGKIVRKYVKETYSEYKFSITTSSSEIAVNLMEAPESIFNKGLEKNYMPINNHSISSNKELNSIGKSVLNDLYSLLKSYNYNDSDAMIDYFDTNFYIYLRIGKWDKPFKIVKKQAD
ncbi:LPD29 domain-containing protein [Clostridioides difficile]|uniref:LPD29 domain-containing protein n=1 Tax=Clostridioides difficile TaxID=1496 RepID=UPI001033BE37|nr:LPD29 domain-containing protein [Clostridioides difficile]MDM9944063.1 hypothetical protein [Clostridioides difficile]